MHKLTLRGQHPTVASGDCIGCQGQHPYMVQGILHSLPPKGQHPYMVQESAFTTTQSSAPLYGPGECIHYHSKVSIPIWFRGMHQLPLKGQHPYMVQGNPSTTTQRSAPSIWSRGMHPPPLKGEHPYICLLYTSPSPRDSGISRMPSSA